MTRPDSKAGQPTASGARAIILRTAWVYAATGRNFVRTMLTLAQTRDELRVVADQLGSPTHTYDVAAAVLALVAREAHGLVHVTNAGAATWFELAAAILAVGGWRTSLTPTATDLSLYPAPRPAFSVLSTDKLTRVAGVVMRPWRDALVHYLSRAPWRGTLDIPAHADGA